MPDIAVLQMLPAEDFSGELFATNSTVPTNPNCGCFPFLGAE